MNSKELHKALITLHSELRQKIKSKWNRSVSFEDELFDRWEKAKFLGFGEGTNIYQDSLVIGDVRIGRDSWIGPYTILDGSGGLEIGDNCSISSGVHIYTHDTVKKRVSGGVQKVERDKTSVGNCCFIGPSSVVIKGVTIGDHSVIGALTFVNKNIPSYSIAVGIPCEIVGKVRIDGNGQARFIWNRVCKDETENSLGKIIELEKQISELRREIKNVKEAKNDR